MRRKKISIIGALVLGLVMSGCGSVATHLEPVKLKLEAGQTLASLNIADYATANNVSSGSKVTSISIDSVATAEAVGTDGNTGKIYINNTYSEWRFYSSGSGTLRLTVADNYTLVSAKGQVATSNYGAPSEVTFTVSNNMAQYTRSGNFNVKSIEVVYSSSGGQQNPTSLTNPDPQFDNSTKTVSWTKDDNAEKYQVKVDSGDYEDIETETYDASNLTLNVEHTVFIKAVGDGTNYSSTEGSVKFVPIVSKSYALCSSVKDLEAGASYMISSGTTGSVTVMSNISNDNNRKGTTVSINNGKILSDASTLTLQLGGDSNGWTFLTENYAGTNGYLTPDSTTSNARLYVKETNDDYGIFSISFNSSCAVITSQGKDSYNVLRYNANNGNPIFSCYSNTQNEVYLWKEVTKTLESLTITGTPSKTTYFVEEQFNPTGITSIVANYSDNSTKDLALTDLSWPVLYLSDHTARGSYTELGTTVYTPNYDVTVQNDSVESLTISGNMTKTAYFTSEQWDKTGLTVTAHYLSGRTLPIDANLYIYSDYEMTNLVERPEDLNQTGSNLKIYIKAEYGLVVSTTPYEQTVSVTVEHGTTAGDPLTATEAFNIGNALADNASTDNYYYIVGVVSEVVGDPIADKEEYGNVTFWLENENDHTTRYFEAFRVVPVSNCDLTQLRVGASVTIHAVITKYVKNNVATIETKQGYGDLLAVSYDSLELTGIALDETNLVMNVSDDHTFTVTAIPTGAEIGVVTWTSSDEDIVMIENNYIVAAAEGTATITARVSETIYAECTVVVIGKSHHMGSNIFSMEFTNSTLPQPTGYVAAREQVDHNNNGYYIEKDSNNNQTALFKVSGGEPLFGAGSADIEFKATIAGGSAKDPLANAIKVVLLDMAGNAIDGTEKTVTTALTTTATEYTVDIPYNADAYGIKMYHVRENGIKVRFYGMELNYKILETYATLLADETNTGVENVKIKFGAKVSVAAWENIILEHGEITDYGVMMFKQTRSPDNYSDTPVQDIYKQGLPLNNVHKGDGTPVSTDGDNYVFSANVKITSEANYGVVFCAAPYVVAGGEYYFLGEMQFSVNTLAQYHQANGGSNLSDTALALLAGTNN